MYSHAVGPDMLNTVSILDRCGSQSYSGARKIECHQARELLCMGSDGDSDKKHNMPITVSCLFWLGNTWLESASATSISKETK